ncbi:MAG: phospholipid carrier-dependent glycosyltransferase [Chloroflexota bacterium]
MRSWKPAPLARTVLPVVLLTGVTTLFFAFLLRRFDYDGIYGDGYAYYHQARALWREITGQPPEQFALFSANGLQHWPVGYHLQIMLGFVLGGETPTGGRLLTLAMASLCPALVYGLLGALAPLTPWLARFMGGLVAAAVLPLEATFTRMGLSLMSDVPSLFFVLIAVLLLLLAWPPQGTAGASSRTGILFALGFGLALGIAVLMRYGTALIAAPLGIYLIVRWLQNHSDGLRQLDRLQRGPNLLWSILGFAVALTPQALYLLTHDPGSGTGDFLSSMSLSNILSSGSVGPDGTESYPQTMLAFYLINPMWDVAGGLLPVAFLPLLLFGLAFLVVEKRWGALALLMASWLIPGIAYAATPYQAHRFTLLYLPSMAILIGLGVAFAVQIGLGGQRMVRPWVGQFAAIVLVLLFVWGALFSWTGVRNWVATHAAWQSDDMKIARLTEQAGSGSTPLEGQSRVVAFGATSAIYHYTGWPVLELYNSDEQQIRSFLAGNGPRLFVVPEASLATQWVGTPLAERWQWILQSYPLGPPEKSGQYTIFRLERP